MNQKPLLYVLIITLFVVLVGFVYLNFIATKSTTTPFTTGKVVLKVTLPPEPESPRTYPTIVQSGTEAANVKPKVAGMERISITANGFSKEEVTITPGDLVTWTNNDTANHKVKGKSWGSGVLTQGKAFSQEFDVVGTFSYSDETNPSFTGRVVVK